MKKKWYDFIPHPAVMLFMILVFATLLTYLIPSGEYQRELVEGRERVVPGSYHLTEQTPVSFFQMFIALPLGFQTAVKIVFIVLASGIMFGFLQESGAIENAVGTMVRKMGESSKYLIIVLMTFVYSLLGVFVGYENNIAMVPIAALISLAIGGDLVLAAGISVGAITIGFGLSPFNPYTLGTGQKIAQLPMFSGVWLRAFLCLAGVALLAAYNAMYFSKIVKDPSKSLALGLDTEGFKLSRSLEKYKLRAKDQLILGVFVLGLMVMLYGVFIHHWEINELSAIFCILSVIFGLISRKSSDEFGEITLKSVSVVAPGAFMVGFASAIKVVLETGHINDTIAYNLSGLLTGLPAYLSGIGMMFVQSVMNFLIPSGSGQALATLPVLIPVGEVLGLTRQTTVLAFQVGDGLTNLINPAAGGLIAMIAMCRVPFDKWLRFIFPLVLVLLLVTSLTMVFAVLTHYGPF